MNKLQLHNELIAIVAVAIDADQFDHLPPPTTAAELQSRMERPLRRYERDSIFQARVQRTVTQIMDRIDIYSGVDPEIEDPWKGILT